MYKAEEDCWLISEFMHTYSTHNTIYISNLLLMKTIWLDYSKLPTTG